MNVYDEIKVERSAQDKKWGGPEHDDAHEAEDWAGFIRTHTTRAFYAERGNPKRPGDSWRGQLIRVAALAIAAIESHDRKEAKPHA